MGRGSGSDRDPAGGDRRDGTDSIDLIAAQERAAEKFFEASDELTLDLASDLARTLRQVAKDGELWAQLEEGSRTDLSSKQVKQLVLLDWGSLLEQWGINDAGEIALELINAVNSKPSEPGAWDQVPALLVELAEQLDFDVRDPKPPDDRGWWRGVRERAASGISALRRVKIGALVVRAAKSVADAAVPTLIGAGILGVAVGSPAGMIGAAVWGLGWTVVASLREALASHANSGSLLDPLFDDPALQPGGVGVRTNRLEVIDLQLANAEGLAAPEWVLDIVADLRAWAAHVGARLATAWPLIAANLGKAGVRDIERTMSSLIEFQRALRELGNSACSEVAGTVQRAVGTARKALDRVAGSLQDLDRRLVDAGFGDAGHG